MTSTKNPKSKSEMSTEEDPEDKPETQSKEAIKKLLRACGKSVYSRLLNDLEALRVECSVFAPAVISKVSFGDNYVRFSVQVPFTLPHRSRHPNDLIRSKQDLLRFRSEFSAFLHEQHQGRQISNLFYDDFDKFLLRFLGAYRLGIWLPSGEVREDSQTGNDIELTVAQSLRIFQRQSKARRLSGPRKLRIPKGSSVERDKLILLHLGEMRKKLADQINTARFKDNDSVRQWIGSLYKVADYPWIKYLKQGFTLLDPKESKKGGRRAKSLRDPKSWSVRQLAECILVKKWKGDYGEEYPRKLIANFLKKARRRNLKIK